MWESLKSKLLPIGLTLLVITAGIVGVLVSNKTKADSRIKRLKDKLDDTQIKANKKIAARNLVAAKKHMAKAEEMSKQKGEVVKYVSIDDAITDWNEED